ncbi:putative ABC transport system permease protein [Candidatus Methylobacter favarea]|uniref:Putative ABC transport system permease protein n=1 Tax=Candidatus Methylobacter favarea TaxID=2707345 RepID=A0A8S0XEM2_9GAMM|nr:ABC transporter permease [Candidatus Methylobacter favarea]CAA9889894.1 putative ABC transport system permease protein [Candidatus Methylobacter favarea]
MTEVQTNPVSSPQMEVSEQDNGQSCVKLSGNWNIRSLALTPGLRQKLKAIAADKATTWDMHLVDMLDSATALMLWQAWGEQMPTGLMIKPEHQRLFERWQGQNVPAEPSVSRSSLVLNYLLQMVWSFWAQLVNLVSLLGQLVLDFGYLLVHPADIPVAEISITIYEAGVRALGITALVGFLIGIVLSYLSALQLKTFGAEIYIIDILGLSIIRELGPLLAAILVAGRSGSAMTAQIGIMRVTEELDALSAMGISHSLRLILPKVAALTVVLPLLSAWTSAAALIGGMFSAQNTLDISYQQFFLKLPDVVPLLNVFIGLGKSAVFGLFIALIACHFGFRIKPNTESLGSETTNSVVAAITVVIMIDAMFAILFMGVGMP